MRYSIVMLLILVSLKGNGAGIPDLWFSMAAANELLASGRDPGNIKKGVREMCKATSDNNGKLNTSCVRFSLALQLSSTRDNDNTDLYEGKRLLDNIDYTQQDIIDFIKSPNTRDALTYEDFPVYLAMAILYENMGAQSQNLVYLETSKNFLSQIEPHTQNQFKSFILTRKTAVENQIFRILNPNQIIAPAQSRFSRFLMRLGIL